MPEAQTWIIIIKFKTPVEIQPRAPSPFFGPRRGEIGGFKIEATQTIILDKPLIIMPNGQADKIEVFPITDQTLIHGKNFRRFVK